MLIHTCIGNDFQDNKLRETPKNEHKYCTHEIVFLTIQICLLNPKRTQIMETIGLIRRKKFKESFVMIFEVLTHNWVLISVKKYIPSLFPLVLLIVLIASLAMGFYLTTQSGYEELGTNILVELGGIFFTIYVVDFFFKKFDRIKSVPTRVIAWRQLASSFDKYFILWNAAFRSANIKTSGRAEDFLNQELFMMMMRHLDLNKSLRKGGKVTWGQLIQNVSIATKRDLLYSQNLHSGLMGPKLIIQVHEFMASDFMGSLLELMKLNELRGSGNHTFYHVSLKPNRNYFHNLKRMHNWLVTEKKRLLMLSDDDYLIATLKSRYF